MLDANKTTDIKEMLKYGKGKGFLAARRYNLPTYSNFYILESEDDVRTLLDTYYDQNNFCMRSDAKIGDVSIGIGGQNGNRETIFEYIRKVKQKSNELGSSGVVIIYWNNVDFCPTYEVEGCFYLDFITGSKLNIDYIGKGWDGSCLSHGSACHEAYEIPWKDILFLDDKNRIRYRRKVVGQSEYDDLRARRIFSLIEKGVPREIVERSVPDKYDGIKSEYFCQMVEQVILPMYCKDLQFYYKEYIPIVQIEHGKIVVPEIILPKRLRFKEMSQTREGR